MPIKDKIIFIIIFILCLNVSTAKLYADEFDIYALEISFDKEKNIIIGKGSVEVKDKSGKIIKADKAIYDKTSEFLTAEGSVNLFDVEGNILKTDKITYNKITDIIIANDNSELMNLRAD